MVRARHQPAQSVSHQPRFSPTLARIDSQWNLPTGLFLLTNGIERTIISINSMNSSREDIMKPPVLCAGREGRRKRGKI